MNPIAPPLPVPDETNWFFTRSQAAPRNVPLNATEIFGVSQMVSICETYERLARRSGCWPMIYMSHIAGIFDDYLQNYVKENRVALSPDALWQAGLAAARRVMDAKLPSAAGL